MQSGFDEAGDEKARARDPIRALSLAWPRPVIASGRGEALARWWHESRQESIRLGAPPFARHAMTPALATMLFEARRARWLRRGLEESETALLAEEAGLRRAPATQTAAGTRRISRLLVLTDDGSARFYRQVEKLCREHGQRLEALVLECDELELGEAIFGGSRVARAVLLDHKEAVLRFLEALDDGGERPGVREVEGQ